MPEALLSGQVDLRFLNRGKLIGGEEVMKRHSIVQNLPIVASVSLTPQLALAASFEGSLQALVTGFIGRILPILALGYLGKNIFDHIQNDPNAGRSTVRVVIAIVALLGINAVWSWLQDKVR